MSSPAETPAEPRLLAFDTSTERLTVAVAHGAANHGFDGEGGAAASKCLLPQVLRLLRCAGFGLPRLQGIAFGRGPGAFTGLRTSCSVAQGLAFGLGLPLMPIDSLLIVAEDARLQALRSHDRPVDFEVTVAMDARMNELYVGRYRYGHGHDKAEGAWRNVLEPALVTPGWLADHWLERPPEAVAGSAWGPFQRQRLVPAGASVFEIERDRAGALLRLARQAFATDATDAVVDAALGLPHYLRDKVAETTAERALARSARAP